MADVMVLCDACHAKHHDILPPPPASLGEDTHPLRPQRERTRRSSPCAETPSPRLLVCRAPRQADGRCEGLGRRPSGWALATPEQACTGCSASTAMHQAVVRRGARNCSFLASRSSSRIVYAGRFLLVLRECADTRQFARFCLVLRTNSAEWRSALTDL
jgi:hypothetical protein